MIYKDDPINSIIKTATELQEYKIENNIIKQAEVCVIAHFGNIPCFTLYLPNCSIGSYNNLSNLGYVIQAFSHLFDLEEEDGINISKFKNIPCRVVISNDKIVGIGHFIKDIFVVTKDLLSYKGGIR